MSVLDFALSNAIIATLLALVAASVERITMKPQVTHALWLLVLVKLVTPPMACIPVPFSVRTKAESSGTRQPTFTPSAVTTPSHGSEHFEAGEVTQAQDAVLPPQRSVIPTLDRTSDVGEVRRLAPGNRAVWSTGLVAVWVTGSVIWFGLAIIRLARFRRVLRFAEPASDALNEEVRSIGSLYGLRHLPRVLVAKAKIPPLICGMGTRTCMVLPSDLMDALKSDERAGLLAHELAHVRRFDHWIRWLEFVTLGVHWWNPVAWWARRQIQQAEEACCDGWVLWAFPDSARVYARTLIKTVDFLSGSPRLNPVIATRFHQGDSLKRRVEMIVNKKVSRRLPWMMRAAFLLFAMCVLPISLFASETRLAKTPDRAANSKPPANTTNAATDSSAVWVGQPPARVDRFGDPLPPRAAVRLGTVRLRQPGCGRVAFTPDGKMLLSSGAGMSGGIVWFWDPATGNRIKKIPHGARAVAFAPDGKQVALACSDGTVRLWDIEKTEEIFTCRPQAEDGTRSGRLNDIAFSPDGAWFASAEQQGVIRLWDPAGGEEILALRHGGERRGGLICLAVSADGRRLASAYGSNIRVWDIERGGEPVLIEEAHEQETNAIAFSSDGKTLYSTGFGSERVGTGKDRYSKTHSQIRVWDALTGHRTGEIGGKLEEDLTTGMVLTADGKSLMVSSFRAIRAFELPSGRLRYSIRLEESSRRYRRGALDVSPDGQTMAVAMGNASLQIWDLKTRTRRHAVREAHVAAIRAVTFNPDGRRAITGSSDGSIRIWNSATGEQIRKFLYAGWTMNLKSVANSPDGKVVAAAGNYSNIRAGTIGAVKLWNAASGELLHEIHLPASGFAMAFSHDGQRLAATTIGPGPFGSTEAATIHLIDVRSGKTLTKLSGHVQTVSAVGFSPDDRELVSIDQDQTIRVWDVAKGKPSSSSEIESNMAAAISTDAAMSVFSQRGRQGRSITLWDVAASKSLWSVDGSTTGFGAHLLDISRDGKRVASCWKDTLSVWSTATANQLHELADPDAQMSALAFSPDGRQVMTGMNDGTALIWDISSTRATRDPE